MGLQFIFVVIGTSVVVSIASLLWPKFTSQPRPAPLEQVSTIVTRTPFDAKAAAFIDPINVSSVAGSLAHEVQQKTQQAVVSTVVTQLAKEYGQLPQDQKKQFEEIVCKPTP